MNATGTIIGPLYQRLTEANYRVVDQTASLSAHHPGVAGSEMSGLADAWQSSVCATRGATHLEAAVWQHRSQILCSVLAWTGSASVPEDVHRFTQVFTSASFEDIDRWYRAMIDRAEHAVVSSL